MESAPSVIIRLSTDEEWCICFLHDVVGQNCGCDSRVARWRRDNVQPKTCRFRNGENTSRGLRFTRQGSNRCRFLPTPPTSLCKFKSILGALARAQRWDLWTDRDFYSNLGACYMVPSAAVATHRGLRRTITRAVFTVVANPRGRTPRDFAGNSRRLRTTGDGN